MRRTGCMGVATIIAASGCLVAVWAFMRTLASERQRRLDELKWQFDKEAEESSKAAQAHEQAGKRRQNIRMAA